LKSRSPVALFPETAEQLHHEFAPETRPGGDVHCQQAPRPISSTINQQLIAERLKLSRTTVSRSLANHPAISADTRAQVQSLAAKMGYRGNPTRSLRRSRQSKPLTVGVLIGVPAENVAMATFPFILQGIRERAGMEHVSIDVCFENPASFEPAVRPQSIFRSIRHGDWRGTVLIYPVPEQTVAMIARKISAVAVLECYSTPGIDTIDTDDSVGILALVTRLRHAGHTRIGFLTWEYPVVGHWATRRFGAYVEALFSLGLQFHPDWSINIHKSGPHIKEEGITDQVLQRIRDHRVTAWVCAADHQAYRLMEELHARGVRVPEDCSVTGFDGLEPPQSLRRLASIRVPHEDIGSSAVARLLSRIVLPNSPRRKILVEGLLVEGETVAPPPKR
jgi:LacI family transcriptional regulator